MRPFPSTVSEEMQAVVRRCLTTSTERYDSSELVRALGDLSATLPVATRKQVAELIRERAGSKVDARRAVFEPTNLGPSISVRGETVRRPVWMLWVLAAVAFVAVLALIRWRALGF